ncbi:MAG: glycosyltransferase, partial [Verrucomicrobia bacterium]|nr:glycosyltransferase [Verrucomicrobiota bacterium]
AQRLNRIIPEALRRLTVAGQRVQVVHLTGKTDEFIVRSAYEQAGIKHIVAAYLADIDKAYAAANLAITRSGAGTCHELAARGLPAMLVPYPQASRDHQFANAQELERIGGACVVRQQQLTVDAVCNYITYCMDHPEKLTTMRQALLTWAVTDGASRLATEVETVCRKSME